MRYLGREEGRRICQKEVDHAGTVHGHHDRIREGGSTTQPPPPSITFTVEAGTKALDWINVGVGEYKGRSKIPVVLGFSVANGPPTIFLLSYSGPFRYFPQLGTLTLGAWRHV